MQQPLRPTRLAPLGALLLLAPALQAQRARAPAEWPRVSVGLLASVSTLVVPETPLSPQALSAAAGFSVVVRPSRRLVVEGEVHGYGRLDGGDFYKGRALADTRVVERVTYDRSPRQFAATSLRAGVETAPRAVRLRATAGGGWLWQVGVPYATTTAAAVIGSGWIRATVAADGWLYALPRVEQELEYEGRRPVRVLSERRTRDARQAIALRLGVELPLSPVPAPGR